MKTVLIIAMIFLFAGCADWDGAGRRDGNRHNDRGSQHQDQGHGRQGGY
ncbi:MAG: hypothetical protein NT163_02270 [Chlorobiales bacterium]|nr:hypothetical protein [Chlorobiales bacterium]